MVQKREIIFILDEALVFLRMKERIYYTYHISKLQPSLDIFSWLLSCDGVIAASGACSPCSVYFRSIHLLSWNLD